MGLEMTLRVLEMVKKGRTQAGFGIYGRWQVMPFVNGWLQRLSVPCSAISKRLGYLLFVTNDCLADMYCTASSG